MITSYLFLSHGQIFEQRLWIKIISKCQMLSMSLQLVLVLSQKQHNFAYCCNYIIGLILAAPHSNDILYIQFVSYIHLPIQIRMQVYTLGNSRDQLSSKNATSLFYQLNLLKERNKILNLENQNLVIKVEQLQKQIADSKDRYKLLMKERNQFINSFQKSKLQIDSITKALGQRFQINNQKKVLQEMKKNQCSLHSLLQILRQIIQNQLLSGQKKKKSQQNLNRLNKLVQRRRQKILQRQQSKKQIIHVIKQPTFKQTYLTEPDLQYVMRSSEKLIRRVKKADIRNQQITKIMDQISNFIRIRQVIRKQQRKLQQLEREAQLGVGSRLTVEVLGNQLMALQVDELNLKKTIQIMIFNL